MVLFVRLSRVGQPGFFKTNIVSAGLDQGLIQLWKTASPQIRERYGDKWFEGKIADFHLVTKDAGEPSVVVDGLVHAVSSTRPKSRYVLAVAVVHTSVFFSD